VGIDSYWLGGVAASDSLVLSKSGIDLVKIGMDGGTVDIPFTVFLTTLLVFTVIIQLYSLNTGLGYALPTLVIPLFFTFYTVGAFVNGMFMEGGGSGLGRVGCGVGLGLLILGVIFLGEKETEIAERIEG
jgi:hypothetical protein